MISYIHDILLIPHPPNAPPHPPNPTCWGVGYEKNIVYIPIHTHMLVPRLRWETNWKSSDSISDSTVLGNFTGKLNAKPPCSWLNRSQTDLSLFFSSDYGDPIVFRTAPYVSCNRRKIAVMSMCVVCSMSGSCWASQSLNGLGHIYTYIYLYLTMYSSVNWYIQSQSDTHLHACIHPYTDTYTIRICLHIYIYIYI